MTKVQWVIFCFWGCFEILGGFGHSKRELVVEILFFLFTGAPREKTQRRSRDGLEKGQKTPRG